MLRKPFDLRELLARIHALLRRALPASREQATRINLDHLSINLAARCLKRDGPEILLTRKEFALLQELVTDLDQVVSYQHLLDVVWGPAYKDIRTIHVHMRNLRHKLEQDPPVLAISLRFGASAIVFALPPNPALSLLNGNTSKTLAKLKYI